MVVVVVRLYVAVVLLFEVLNEENSFEEFSTDSESALVSKVGNIGFDGYIGTCILWIYRIYRRYIGGYFFINIDISKINKNTLKFINILSKTVKMTLIIKYIHCNDFLKSK